MVCFAWIYMYFIFLFRIWIRTFKMCAGFVHPFISICQNNIVAQFFFLSSFYSVLFFLFLLHGVFSMRKRVKTRRRKKEKKERSEINTNATTDDVNKNRSVSKQKIFIKKEIVFCVNLKRKYLHNTTIMFHISWKILYLGSFLPSLLYFSYFCVNTFAYTKRYNSDYSCLGSNVSEFIILWWNNNWQIIIDSGPFLFWRKTPRKPIQQKTNSIELRFDSLIFHSMIWKTPSKY